MSDLTLAGFLAARLGEDEAAAKAAAKFGTEGFLGRPAWVNQYGMVVDAADVDWAITDLGGTAIHGDAVYAHIARHDPARVLREVQAKRTLLRYFTDPQTHEPLSVLIAPDAYALGRGEGTTLPGSWILRELAAVYSDHPDYREEWKP